MNGDCLVDRVLMGASCATDNLSSYVIEKRLPYAAGDLQVFTQAVHWNVVVWLK